MANPDDKAAGDTINFLGKQVDTLRFKRHTREHDSGPSYTLNFYHGRKRVAQVDDVKESALADVVGRENSEAIKSDLAHRAGNAPGSRNSGILKVGKLKAIEAATVNSIEPSPEFESAVRAWVVKRWGDRDAGDRTGARDGYEGDTKARDAAEDVARPEGSAKPATTVRSKAEWSGAPIPVPDHVARRFTQGDKNQYYFDWQRHKLAFVDKGIRLETMDASPVVAQSLVEIALTRGWETMRVRGSHAFRREVWLAAELGGAEVVGYEPSEGDKLLLQHKFEQQGMPGPIPVQRQEENPNALEPAAEPDKGLSARLASNVERGLPDAGVSGDWQAKSQEPAVAQALDALEALSKKDFEQAVDIWNRVIPNGAERPAFVDPEWKAQIEALRQTTEAINERLRPAAALKVSNVPARLTGRVVAHGEAPFQYIEDNQNSYFVRLESPNGQRRDAWGKDLGRAMLEADADVGDFVELQRVERTPVVVKEPVRDEAGAIIGERDKRATFNSWSVQKANEFRQLGAEYSLSEHPELFAAHATIATTANALANRYGNKADSIREKFRARLAEKIERNEPISVPKVRAEKALTTRERKSPAPNRGKTTEPER